MKCYDTLLKCKNRIVLVTNTLRLRLQFYRNVQFKGLVNIHRSTRIHGISGGTVIIGDRVSTSRNCTLVSVGGALRIGNHTGFNENCIVVCHSLIDIGPNCRFGPHVYIYDHDHRYGYDGIQEGFNTSPVIIEKNCWLGADVTILRGTHIGEGCVISAGTVIKGEIPAHSIVRNEHNLIIKSIESRDE